MLNTDQIRQQFPAISHHSDFIYFDNAATAQKPQVVLDAVAKYHHSFYSNSHRSMHDWGMRSTKAVESVRQKLADLLSLPSTQGLY